LIIPSALKTDVRLKEGESLKAVGASLRSLVLIVKALE
jgi:hypothetical protein